jgi:putative endonuclease
MLLDVLYLLLFSKSHNRFYTGQTSDPDRGIVEHNRRKMLYISRGLAWILICSISFESRSEAVQLEKRIKKFGAKKYLEKCGKEVS